MRYILIMWLAVTGLAFSLPLQAQESGPKEWVLGGSGANTLLTEVLAKAFTRKYPDIHIKVLSSIGSSGGIKGVYKGKITLGLVSRPFRGIERTWGLKSLPYARTVIVFGANPSVPDDNLSTKDVLDIYAGKRSKWSDGSRIVVLVREDGDSSAEVLAKTIAGFKDILENAWRSGIWRIEYRDSECNASIGRIRNALGWTDLGSIRLGNHKIKPLKFNGVVPAAESLLSGKYPFYKDLVFVYREPLPEPLRKFTDFVRSEEGTELIRENGYMLVP